MDVSYARLSLLSKQKQSMIGLLSHTAGVGGSLNTPGAQVSPVWFVLSFAVFVSSGFIDLTLFVITLTVFEADA
ncbi:hypothetical protein BDV09DRAFT_167040 [Aspergillus tetrazonus]